MSVSAKVAAFFTRRRPYPEWAYATRTQQRVATLIDMAIVYPALYLLMRDQIVPAFVRYAAEPGRKLSLGEEFLLEMATEGAMALLFSTGWMAVPLVLLMVPSIFFWPLALYHLVLEASPLKASPGKIIQGFWVVQRRGDPLTIGNALSRFVARVMIVPRVLGTDEFDVVQRDAPRNE